MGALKRALLDVDEAPDYAEEPCPTCQGDGTLLTDNSPYAVEERCGDCRGSGTIVTLPSEWA